MSKQEKETIALFRKRFQRDYPHISYDMTDQQIADKLFEIRDPSLKVMMDLFSDYLLANGLCEVQE
jgi:hypothetical protein